MIRPASFFVFRFFLCSYQVESQSGLNAGDENANQVDQVPLVTSGLWHLQLHRPAAQQSAQLCDRFGIVINRHAGRCGGFNQVGWSRSGATMAKKKKN